MTFGVRRLTRIVITSVASLAIVCGITGCGTPPWLADGAAASPSPSAKPSPTGEITSIINDLATGSTQRTLTAGNIGLTVDYWSDLNMDQWTAGANKPLSFSLSGTLTGDLGEQVYLSQVSLTAAVSDEDGALPAPATIADRTTVSPGYLIKAPYSYSQTFILPALDPAATSVTLGLTYEILLQTTPTSAQYAKQTATDTLTIAIAPA